MRRKRQEKKEKRKDEKRKAMAEAAVTLDTPATHLRPLSRIHKMRLDSASQGKV